MPISFPICSRRPLRAFTLIELLVVVGILAILLAILLPSLAKARLRAKTTTCLSNLSQVAKGAAVYEADYSRLPLHLNELDPASFPNTIASYDGSNSHDVRTLWAPYVNVDYFNCPFVLKWQPSKEPFLAQPNFNINVEYAITAGYFGDGDDTTYASRFTRSLQPWTYNGRTFKALVGDRSYYSPSGSTVPSSPLFRTFDNHADSRRDFVLRISAYPRPVGRGWYTEKPTDDDARLGGQLNFAFTDGSARTFKANDPEIVQVKDRNSTTVGPKTNYLIPSE